MGPGATWGSKPPPQVDNAIAIPDGVVDVGTRTVLLYSYHVSQSLAAAIRHTTSKDYSYHVNQCSGTCFKMGTRQNHKNRLPPLTSGGVVGIWYQCKPLSVPESGIEVRERVGVWGGEGGGGRSPTQQWQISIEQ